MISYLLQPSGQALFFSSKVIQRFVSLRQLHSYDSETGGQLFAKLQSGAITIEEATGPRAADKRSRFSFRPDRVAERLEIADQHRRGLHFIGDWHTHPEDVPKPSRQDLTSFADMFKRSTHQLNGMVMVIAGRKLPPDGLFVGIGDDKFMTQLKPIAPDNEPSSPMLGHSQLPA